MKQPPDHGRLDQLDARLKTLQTEDEKLDAQANGAALGRGLSVAVELVAAVVVGAFIGWFLDQWLGTKPWLVILFCLLGGVAGFLNIYRSAMRIADEADRTAAREQAGAAGNDETKR